MDIIFIFLSGLVGFLVICWFVLDVLIPFIRKYYPCASEEPSLHFLVWREKV